MTDTKHDPETDDVTTLAKMNGSPQSPDDEAAAGAEREDTDTVLAKMNDNPSREETDEQEPTRPAMIR